MEDKVNKEADQFDEILFTKVNKGKFMMGEIWHKLGKILNPN